MRRSQRTTSAGGRGDLLAAEGGGRPAAGGGIAGVPAEILLVLIGGLVYLNSFAGQFIFDDHRTILQGRLVSMRPLVSGSILLNRALAGAMDRPLGPQDVWGFHLFNLGVHLLAGLALLGVARRTLRRVYPNAAERCEGLAFAIAAIWLVHPIQTQSVTYLIQRSESMMGMVYLLALYCLARAADCEDAKQRAAPVRIGKQVGWQLAAVAAFFLGMGCKSVIITLPLTAILLDYCLFPRSPTARWRLWLPIGFMMPIAGIMLAHTGILDKLFGQPATVPTSVGFNIPDLSAVDYLKTQPQVILHYLKLSFWPSVLSLDYGWPVATDRAAIAASSLAVLVLIGVGVGMLLWHPPLGFVIVTFFVLLVPTSSFVPIRDLCVEHRMYLSLACVVAAVVVAADALVRRSISRGWLMVAGGQRALMVLFAAALVALGWRTMRRNADYHSEIGMWRAVTQTCPDNPRGWWGMGVFLRDAAPRAAMESGNHKAQAELLQEAVAAFHEAIHLQPNAPKYHTDLGTALAGLRQFDDAIACHRTAIEIDPNYAAAHNNMGEAMLQQQRIQEAFVPLRRAVELDPRMAEAHNNLGKAYVGKGDLPAAIRETRRAIEIRPGYAEAHLNLALMLAATRQGLEAGEHYREALRLKPELAMTSAAQSLIVDERPIPPAPRE